MFHFQIFLEASEHTEINNSFMRSCASVWWRKGKKSENGKLADSGKWKWFSTILPQHKKCDVHRTVMSIVETNKIVEKRTTHEHKVCVNIANPEFIHVWISGTVESTQHMNETAFNFSFFIFMLPHGDCKGN